MPGPWEKYQKPQQAGESGPWARYQQAPEEPGIGQQILEGVGAAGEFIDKYTGAPTRAAIGAVQEGEGLGGAAEAFGEQFGEDPGLAPTGEDIAKRAGLSDEALAPGVSPTEAGIQALQSGGSMGDAAMAIGNRFLEAPWSAHPATQLAAQSSPAEIAGLGIDIAADPTNVVPVGPLAKVAAKGARGGVRGLRAAGGTAAKLGEKGVTGLTKKVGSLMTGVPEKEIETYIRRHPEVEKVITQYGDNMQEAADVIREGFQKNIHARRRALGTSIGDSLDRLPQKKVVPAKAVLDELEAVKSRLNKKLQLEEVGQVDELIQRVGGLADEAGNVTAKEMFQIKEFLQDRGKPAFMKAGQLFAPGKQAQMAAKNASGKARELVNTISPSIKEANKELHRLHVIEGRINKNLIAPGKSAAALGTAGARTNLRNVKELELLSAITGKDLLGQAETYAAAQRFAAPGLAATDTTGKSVERMLKASLAGGVLGGPVGAAIAAGMTSPMALKAAIKGGRVPVKLVNSVAGTTGKVTDKTIDAFYQALKTKGGQRRFDAALKAARVTSVQRQENKKGPRAWANRGARKLGLSPKRAEKLMQSKKGMKLLIEISDLKPGSKRFMKIQQQLKEVK